MCGNARVSKKGQWPSCVRVRSVESPGNYSCSFLKTHHVFCFLLAKAVLVSTDPASNVGQVFGISIDNNITPVPAIANLSALEITPPGRSSGLPRAYCRACARRAGRRCGQRHGRQLSGACTTEIASFDELTELLVGSGASCVWSAAKRCIQAIGKSLLVAVSLTALDAR